jgi:hypothetical protein
MEVGVSANRRTVFPLFIVLGLVAISCSDHESPTAPSSSSAMSRGTISGTLLATSEASAGRGGAVAGEPLANATVRVVSTGQSTQTDSAGRFTIANVPPGIVNLEIRGSGISSSASVSAASGAVTRVTITVSRGHSTIMVGQRGLEGTIGMITAPNLTVTNRSGTFTVATSSNTRFLKQGSRIGFGDLKSGQTVEVEGSPQQDGSILATVVEVENPEDEETTKTPSPTVTGTPPTATATRTPRPDDEERTRTPTVTGTPPTATPTRTPEPEDEETRTPSPTVTGTPPTATATRTPEPEDDNRTKSPTVTGTPTAMTPTPTPEPEEDLSGKVGSVRASRS